MAKLKNGAEELPQLITVTMMSLDNLMKTNPIALVDLVLKCKDRDYKFFGNNEAILKDLALVADDGMVHGSIRNIVLSAVTGEGLDIGLGSPLA